MAEADHSRQARMFTLASGTAWGAPHSAADFWRRPTSVGAGFIVKAVRSAGTLRRNVRPGAETDASARRTYPVVYEVTWLPGRCASSCPGPGLVRDPCHRAVPGNPVSGRHWGKRRRFSRGIPPGGQRVPVRFEADRHSRDPCHRVPDIAPGFGRRPTLLRTVPQRLTLRSVCDSLFVFLLFLFSAALALRLVSIQ